MTRTGGADRPGPAPNAKNHAGVRETQKRGVVRQALQGLHGPLLLGCGQGLAPHRFIGKRRAVSSIHAGRAASSGPVSLDRHSARPGFAPLRIRQPPFRWPPSGQFGDIVRTRRTAPSPARTTAPASSAGTAPVKIVRRPDQPGARSGASAPGPREPLRDQVIAGIHAADRDSGKRPPIGIGPLPLDLDPAPRQQPDERHARGIARGRVATQA